MTIVGVVGDVRYQGLDVESRPVYYIPHDQGPQATYGGLFFSMSLIVRAGSDARFLAASLRDAVRDLDADLPIVDLRTMDDVVADSVARPRFTSRLLGLFAFIALLLGATGIYGVLAHMVAQRAREIGIRKALGASRGELAAMVIAQGMGLVGLGLLIGVAGSVWIVGELDALLYGASSTDLSTYLIVIASLSVVALAACCIPTLRAVRVDPLVALRAD